MDGMGILEVLGVSDRSDKYIYLRWKVVKLKALDAFEYIFVHLSRELVAWNKQSCRSLNWYESIEILRREESIFDPFPPKDRPGSADLRTMLHPPFERSWSGISGNCCSHSAAANSSDQTAELVILKWCFSKGISPQNPLNLGLGII